MSKPENSPPPEFTQVTFICLHGKSRELVLHGKIHGALDRSIAQNAPTQHPHLRGMLIIGPDGDAEEIHR